MHREVVALLAKANMQLSLTDYREFLEEVSTDVEGRLDAFDRDDGEEE